MDSDGCIEGYRLDSQVGEKHDSGLTAMFTYLSYSWGKMIGPVK